MPRPHRPNPLEHPGKRPLSPPATPAQVKAWEKAHAAYIAAHPRQETAPERRERKRRESEERAALSKPWSSR